MTSGSGAAAVGGIDVLGVVKKTVEHQPAIHIQREQVNLARGAYRSSGGDFDWRVETFFIHRQDYDPIPAANSIKNQEVSEAGLRFSRLLRSGISVEPFLQYTGSEYRLVTDEKLSPSKTGSVGLLFRVPLLRGLGYENTAAGEIAAALDLQAAQLNLAHEISFAVHNGVQAFWAYLAAHERLAVLAEAEERALVILKKTQALVQADELPAAELVNVRANLADKESGRLAAAQAVVAARAGLGMAMGIPPAETYDLPAPFGPFPDLDRTLLLQAMAADSAAYARIAARHRLDLLAAGKQNESLKTGLRAARNRVKPALNLELSLGYDGLESGSSLSRSLRTAEYRQDAPDWSTGVRLTYPLGNNSGEGELAQALARHRQGWLREQELLRTIATDIGLARSDLFSIFHELERSDEAVRQYTTAVANEREKYLMGETTLLDLLYIEDRRDSALLNRIAVRQRAASGLARLRFETGTLVRVQDEEVLVTASDLTTVLLPAGAPSP
jgi:outer membrane protein TolC